MCSLNYLMDNMKQEGSAVLFAYNGCCGDVSGLLCRLSQSGLKCFLRLLLLQLRMMMCSMLLSGGSGSQRC